MPAKTADKCKRSRISNRCVAGVDGCRAGWVAVLLYGNNAVDVVMVNAFAELLQNHLAAADAIAVDMPIGLATRGRRGCDALARKALGRGRSSSVFAAPRRGMLACATYEEANAFGKAQGADAGGGLSKQAWHILPKIREVDEAIQPSDQMRIFEAHPEAAFLRLGEGVPPPKKTPEGRQARIGILTNHGLDAKAILQKLGDAKGVATDDALDAAALALTARDRLSGTAKRYSDEIRDARGLVMEIWG
ncbi:MAG: DUF429 domain-containing protein [Pseudomonadota bacterium]